MDKSKKGKLSNTAKGIIAGVAGVVVIAGVAVPTAILATGKNDGVVNNPANTEITITVPGLEGTAGYDITTTNGITFGEFKKLLKDAPEGWQIEGYYKDSDNMDEDNKFDDGDIITEETKIYINYTRIKYTVTFKNYDGTVLYVAENIDYDNTGVEYEGETPTKVADDACTYAFDKWVDENNHDVNLNQRITSDITVYAGYLATPIDYDITFTYLDNLDMQSINIKAWRDDRFVKLGVNDSVHIGETLEIEFNVLNGYTLNLFKIDGAVAVDKNGNEVAGYTYDAEHSLINGETTYKCFYKVTGKGINVTYKQKAICKVGNIPSGVTLNKIVSILNEETNEYENVKIPITNDSKHIISRGDIIEYSFKATEGYTITASEIQGLDYSFEIAENTYLVDTDLTFTFTEEANEYSLTVPSGVVVTYEGKEYSADSNISIKFDSSFNVKCDYSEGEYLTKLTINGTDCLADYDKNNGITFTLNSIPENDAIEIDFQISNEYSVTVASVNKGTVETLAENKGYAYGTKISDIVNEFAKTGYNVLGVYGEYENGEFGEQFADEDIVNGSLTIYINIVKFWTVEFYNGNELLTENPIIVNDGDKVTFSGETPTKKDPTGKFAYTFVGWEDAFNENIDLETYEVTSNIKLYASYDQEYIDYTITFYDEDGTTVLENVANAHIGDVVSYNNNAPTKAGTDELVYDFVGWKTSTGEVVSTADLGGLSVTGNAEFTAVYELSHIYLTFELNTDNDAYIVKSLSNDKNNVVIPQSYNGLSVTAIADNAFSGKTSIKTVLVPDSITSIGANAFYGCSELTEITIPENVTNIGAHAFDGCTKVETLNFNAISVNDFIVEEDDLTQILVFNNFGTETANGTNVIIGSNVQKIPAGMFAIDISREYEEFNPNNAIKINSINLENATSLKEIGVWAFAFLGGDITLNIAEGIEHIGSYAFCGFLGLKAVNLPNSLEEIDFAAFISCINLESVKIGNGLTTLGDGVFENCDALKAIYIPSNVTTISAGLFNDCSSDLVIFCEAASKPNGWADNWNNYSSDGKLNVIWNVKGVDVTEDAIYYIDSNNERHLVKVNTNLTEFTIDSDTKFIDNKAFYNCKNLTSVVIPNSVTSIGSSAFYGCSNLTSITIPDSVTSIGSSAFSGCSKLTRVDILDLEAWCNISFANIYANPLYYAKNLYLNNEFVTNLVIPDSVTSIGSFAFYNCSSLTSVTIENGVTSIGSHAFYGCSNLTSITIPDSVTSIGANAFYSCSNLTSVTIGNSVTSIGTYAFSGCSKLNSIEIPNSVTFIGMNAFQNCKNLTLIYIPASVTTITASSYFFSPFNGCSSNLKILCEAASKPNGWDSYWNYYSSGSKLTVNWNVKEIIETEDAIYYIDGNNEKHLSKVNTGLSNFTIDSDTKVIESNAFYGCSKLTSITIPNSVTSIGSQAFYNCSSLTSVTIGNSVTSIGQSAFYNCSSLTSIIIPNSVTSIGSQAFYNCNKLTSVYIPASVTTITASSATNSPFFGCPSNLKILCEAASKPTGWGSYWNYYRSSSILTVIWNINSIIENEDALYYIDSNNEKHLYSVKNKELTEFTLAADTKIIDNTAFDGCNSLASINVEAGSTNYSSLDGVLYNVDKTSLVRYPTGRQGDFTIPSSVETIESYAFKNCEIDTLTVSENVVTMKGYAFSSCSIEKTNITSLSAWLNIDFYNDYSNPIYQSENLYLNNVLVEELVIPEGTTTIKTYAFYYCGSLTSVIIPDSVKTIENNAFEECYNIESINFGNGVESIGEGAFKYLYSLKEINLPNSLTNIDNEAFYECESVTTLVIPGSVGYIGEYVFYECGDLETLVLGEGIKGIDIYAFAYCGNLSSVTLPNTLKDIGSYAFYNCTSLTSITIPGSVKYIEEEAFADCDNLETIIIGEGVEQIDDNAFKNCTSLTSIYIPASVTTINGQPFRDCDSSLVIYCCVAEKPDDWDDNWNYCDDDTELEVHWLDLISDSMITQDGLIYYIDLNGDKHLYKAESTEITTANIANDAKYIDKGAFDGCNSLTSIIIGNGITYIDSYLFKGCSSLTSITIGNGVTIIGDNAFENCTGLTSITIPNSVTSIGSQAFYNCSSLTSVTIENGVTSIGNYAFSSCSSLISITIPDSVTSLGSSAFSYCSGLTSVTIGSGVTSIDRGDFINCSSLTEIIVDANNKYYCSEDGVLYNKDKTKLIFCPAGKTGELIIPNSVESIESSAFYNCSGLTSVTIGNNVKSIGYSAFKNCTGLTSITIPNSVTSIGACAFENCTGLTSVYIPTSVTTISTDYSSYSPFYKCSSYLKIYCGATSKPSGWGDYWNNYSLYGKLYAVSWNVTLEQYEATIKK